jgi:hypothetical protein
MRDEGDDDDDDAIRCDDVPGEIEIDDDGEGVPLEKLMMGWCLASIAIRYVKPDLNNDKPTTLPR